MKFVKLADAVKNLSRNFDSERSIRRGLSDFALGVTVELEALPITSDVLKAFAMVAIRELVLRRSLHGFAIVPCFVDNTLHVAVKFEGFDAMPLHAKIRALDSLRYFLEDDAQYVDPKFTRELTLDFMGIRSSALMHRNLDSALDKAKTFGEVMGDNSPPITRLARQLALYLNDVMPMTEIKDYRDYPMHLSTESQWRAVSLLYPNAFAKGEGYSDVSCTEYPNSLRSHLDYLKNSSGIPQDLMIFIKPLGKQ